MKKTQKPPTRILEQIAEYRTVSFSRLPREYIEIGYFDGRITSFYESYPGMGGHNLDGYRGYDAESTAQQLISCEWRIN
jgi:hypothetical protein